MRKKIILSLFLVLIGISLLCITACSNINTEKQYQDFAEAAAQQIISNTLKSPSSAIYNETSYIEDNGQGMYVVYVDVEATNSFGAYIRSKFFVIVKDINLEEKTFSYSKLFPYYECSGKNDTYSLNVLKKLNNYDGQSENTEGSDNSNNNPEDPTDPEGGNNDNKPESSADKVTVSFISDGNIISINEIEKNTPIDSAPTVEKKNYKFLGWFLEKQEISFPYTAVNSVTFVAKWEGIDCQYRTNNDGSVQEYTVKYGEKVNILPVTKDGYIFKGWYYGDEQITNEQGVCLEPWHYSEQIELTPKMDLITYDIYYEVNSYGGKIVHEGISNRFFSFEVSVQDDYCAPIITAEPDNGYRFVQWSDGSTDPQRQDTNIHEDITITAEFVRVYNLTFTAGEGGTIQGETSQVVDEGATPTSVTAVPDEGYRFERWEYVVYDTTDYFWSPTITPTLDDISLLLGMEYRAVFTKIAYTATYKTNLGYVGGLLQYDFSENSGDKNPNDYKPEGKHFFEFAITIDNNYSAPIITAKANNGYRFVQWSDGSNDPQRQDTNIHEDITITAEFVRVYNLTFVAGEGGSIQGETSQIVDEGATPTPVTAVPDEGYEFERWEYDVFGTTHYLWTPTITPTSQSELLTGMEYRAVFTKISK